MTSTRSIRCAPTRPRARSRAPGRACRAAQNGDYTKPRASLCEISLSIRARVRALICDLQSNRSSPAPSDACDYLPPAAWFQRCDRAKDLELMPSRFRVINRLVDISCGRLGFGGMIAMPGSAVAPLDHGNAASLISRFPFRLQRPLDIWRAFCYRALSLNLGFPLVSADILRGLLGCLASPVSVCGMWPVWCVVGAGAGVLRSSIAASRCRAALADPPRYPAILRAWRGCVQRL